MMQAQLRLLHKSDSFYYLFSITRDEIQIDKLERSSLEGNLHNIQLKLLSFQHSIPPSNIPGPGLKKLLFEASTRMVLGDIAI